MTTDSVDSRRWFEMIVPRLVGVLAIGALLVPLSAVPSSADLVTLCSGTAGEVTVPGDLLVQQGNDCLLDGTTVLGDVDVRRDANLLMDGATVEGEVLVRADAYLDLSDSQIDGEVRLVGAWGSYAESSDLGHVDVRNSGFFYGDQNVQAGLFSRNGETYLESGWVDGDVTTDLDFMTDLADSVVTGELDVNRAEWGSAVCDSEVDGDAQVRNSGQLVQLGGDGPVEGCGVNVFGAGVYVSGNDTVQGTRLVDNIIRGDLVCENNDPAPTGDGNRVRGEATGQCEQLGPSTPQLEAGDADRLAHKAQLEAQIQDRSAAAEAAAIEAGPADIGH